MNVTAKDVVAKFAPNANATYRKAFEEGDATLAQFGITTPLRLAHFMAQCLHETGNLRILIENGRYTAKNLGDMWDSGNWHRYFPDRAACVAMAEQCARDNGVALFSLVYGNRMGNGAPATQDGWTYRGRGVLQTTGRESYRKYSKPGVDFEAQPDLINTKENVLGPALQEWKSKNLNLAADNNDIKLVTLGINGGTVGLPERKALFAKIWPFVTGAPAVQLSREWRVQEKLKALGYKAVIPDGVIGVNTRAAILDYRVKHGLPSSPGITSDLLLSLGVS
jgi:putative chitinase